MAGVEEDEIGDQYDDRYGRHEETAPWLGYNIGRAIVAGAAPAVVAVEEKYDLWHVHQTDEEAASWVDDNIWGGNSGKT